jgi:hypothetical protein
MNRTRPAVTAIFVLYSACVAAAAPSDNADPAAIRAEFLLRLRYLAEAGQLFDSAAVARSLGMDAHESNRTDPLPLPCEDGSRATLDVTTLEVPNPSWYHALPSGAGHIAIPAFTINPATVSGDPTFKYELRHSHLCPQYLHLSSSTTASVSFDGLPAYSCITPTDIAAQIPSARTVFATDGVFMVNVEGKVDDDAGTELTFSFRAGARCALGATVSQDEERGLRFLRAAYQFAICQETSDHDFCATHQDTGAAWTAPITSQMAHETILRCGLLDSLYGKEPRSGLAPVGDYHDVLMKRRTPCNR